MKLVLTADTQDCIIYLALQSLGCLVDKVVDNEWYLTQDNQSATFERAGLIDWINSCEIEMIPTR